MAVKSVFLYGSDPTVIKQQWLEHTQKEYTALINTFIERMAFDPTYYLALLINNKKAPIVRTLEKKFRSTNELGSAYGQNAVDRAVVELHNHFQRIRNKIFGFVANQLPDLVLYVQSTALFNAVLTKKKKQQLFNPYLKMKRKLTMLPITNPSYTS